MHFAGSENVLILKIIIFLFVVFSKCNVSDSSSVIAGNQSISNDTTKVHFRKVYLTERILRMLTILEDNEEQNISTRLAILIQEFLIKQKVRFFKATRYEAQTFYKILRSCRRILNEKYTATPLQRNVLTSVFQRDVSLIPPVLHTGLINTHLKFSALLRNYDDMVNEELWQAKLSDICFDAIVTLSDHNCKLSLTCLQFVVGNSKSTYGYVRTHQVLLLYILMHHKCATRFAPREVFERLAASKCSQVYRETKVIRNLNVTEKYYDLYLQQTALCALFGYTEFLNWSNVDMFMRWPNSHGCYCPELKAKTADSVNNIDDDDDDKTRESISIETSERICSCQDHISAMLLAYYTNALLLLN